MSKLYGDGVHTDTQAIQEMLDSGARLVALPLPEKYYLIDKPLKIHSYQELKLPRYCTVRLADGSDCHMIENADVENGNEYFSLNGGIWDFNNMGQTKNQNFIPPEEQNPDYDGIVMLFRHVKNFRISDLTVKDPITFSITLDRASFFTVENITFDFNLGNPRPLNMDGVHLDGNCHYGVIRNLKGTCYDDLVALNADEGSDGPITNIDIDGIYSEECHSAVRLLTVKNRVEHIHIHNVYGTFYQYGIGITKYYEGPTEGYYDSLVFENLHMAKAERYPYLHYSEQFALYSYVYPLIYIERETQIHSLSISELYRIEQKVSVPTVFLDESAHIENLTLRNCYNENRTETPFPFFEKRGTVGKILWENNRIVNGVLTLPEDPEFK